MDGKDGVQHTSYNGTVGRRRRQQQPSKQPSKQLVRMSRSAASIVLSSRALIMRYLNVSNSQFMLIKPSLRVECRSHATKTKEQWERTEKKQGQKGRECVCVQQRKKDRSFKWTKEQKKEAEEAAGNIPPRCCEWNGVPGAAAAAVASRTLDQLMAATNGSVHCHCHCHCASSNGSLSLSLPVQSPGEWLWPLFAAAFTRSRNPRSSHHDGCCRTKWGSETETQHSNGWQKQKKKQERGGGRGWGRFSRDGNWHDVQSIDIARRKEMDGENWNASSIHRQWQ